jgi:Protein of unknown function (DUF3667)
MVECPNCGAMRDGAFCGRCGQKAASLNPSFREFLHELFHELAHFDGKIVRSTRFLLAKPGFLSQEYFAGRRARYISPIRLYLVFSILYFAVVTFAPSSGIRITCTSCPPESKVRVEAAMREAFTHWAPRAMFVLVPGFAALIALAARHSGRTYPLHLYFAMHVHAAWFFAALVAALAGIISVPYVTSVVSIVAGFYALSYVVLAFRRAYSVGVAKAMLRMMAVVGTYMLVVALTLLAITLPVAFRG